MKKKCIGICMLVGLFLAAHAMQEDLDNPFLEKQWNLKSPVCSIAFLSDGQTIVTGHGNSKILFYKEDASGTMERAYEWDCAQALRAENYHCASTKFDTIKIVAKRMGTSTYISEHASGHRLAEWNVTWSSPASEEVLCHTDDAVVIKTMGTIKVQRPDEQPMLTIPHGRVATFSPDQKKVAIGCTNGEVYLLKVAQEVIKSAYKR